MIYVRKHDKFPYIFNILLGVCFFLSFILGVIYRKILPPQIGELNIHFGVFFGGLGDFSEAYLNSVDNFRGCMSDVRTIWLTVA